MSSDTVQQDLLEAMKQLHASPHDDEEDAHFVDARSDDGDDGHVAGAADGASSGVHAGAHDPFGASYVSNSIAPPDDGASHGASGASAGAAGSAAGSGFDDKWSEEFHGPALDRSRRAVMEADELEDAKKDAGMAGAFKEEGNRHYGRGDHERAAACYTEALRHIPRDSEFDSHRAVYYCNRAACHLALERAADAVYDSDRALEFNPRYVKALSRRAAALERLKKLEDAIKDHEAIMALEPSAAAAPRAAIDRLKRLAAERDEKLKAEMLGKLKDMGNWVLGKFGLSLDNFKAVQDPATGSYSISFQQ